jgi:phytol kinase
MLYNQWIALVVTFAAALAWLRINDYFAHKGWVSGQLSRKIIHMGTGPIFVLCWFLFPDTPAARYLAALVPFTITVQFFLVGIGVVKDQPAVDAMSRHGDRREILKGPLLYGIVFVILTIVYWHDSPIGIIALMMLSGGDGLADILGRRVDSLKLAWSPRKSLAGTISMFAGGLLFSLVIIWVFVSAGAIPYTFSQLVWKIVLINFIGTTVESLPLNDLDNLTVPIAAVISGHLLGLV